MYRRVSSVGRQLTLVGHLAGVSRLTPPEDWPNDDA